jgi:hypothetical protein
MGVRVFWLEPTSKHRTSLHRWADEKCAAPANGGYNHHASVSIGDFDEHQSSPPNDDPRWRMSCVCGYVFKDTDERSLGSNLLYRRTDNGAETTIGEAGVGAMWDASWFAGTSHHRPGPDGIHLCVNTPGGPWEVDGRASNCTMPDDDVHRCWVRHGDPRTGSIHVDKNGPTCAAGAGSIISGNYHGFLHNGEFT